MMDRKMQMTGASLGTVTRRLGITARALRYYEEKGLVKVSRDRWNRRRYDAWAQQEIEIVVRLRGCGLGVRSIAALLSAYRRGEPLADLIAGQLNLALVEIDRLRTTILAELQSHAGNDPKAGALGSHAERAAPRAA
jgi:DNA-binding transcriptional MerR regulator